MIEIITAWGINQILAYTGGAIGVFILTWLFKKIPTKKIRYAIYTAFFKAGVLISGFFTKWKYTKAFWQNTFEPWLIGFLDMIFGAIIEGLFDGLRSDD